MIEADVLLDIRSLRVEYASRRRLFGRHHPTVRVLDGFSLRLRRGETLAVVGESGCGKTTLAGAVARFIPASGGQVLFDGRNILAFDELALRAYRRDMQMVFQNPTSSLDPRWRVGAIVAEPLATHTGIERPARRARAEALLAETGLAPEYMERYPHELSGGQAQRVALARALALSPKLLLLDEPTSALDVSVQAQVLNLLQELQRRHGLTYMIISHSLGVVQHISDRIAVLYLGEIVEFGPRRSIFTAPRHPYTQALFASTPIPDPRLRRQFAALQGTVPSPANPPEGCRFHTRCPHAMPLCRETKPAPCPVGEGHWVACHLFTSGETTEQHSIGDDDNRENAA